MYYEKTERVLLQNNHIHLCILHDLFERHRVRVPIKVVKGFLGKTKFFDSIIPIYEI